MRLADNIEGHDDIVESLGKMEKRMDELEYSFNTKMDTIIKNQDNFIAKVDRVYDTLVGTPLTNNEGLLVDIKQFKKETNNKIENLEKYIEKIKTFMWFLGVACTVAGALVQMLWQYIISKK